jgi:RNA exonuclease 1
MFMQSLCSDQTVVVGHAVHNDLLALRMRHHANVDTAMLYVSEDDDGSTPSLKNLAINVLKKQMPDVHDSVNDARVALDCAEHYRSKGGNVAPVEKVFTRKRMSTDPADTTMLLVHRLPATTQPNHLVEMFLAYTNIKPKNVPDILFSGSHGKCNVEFTTKEHAELAYNTLAGEERKDKTGKEQKRVSLKGGGYVCVRKMKKTN